jgi:outer membrane lipoprotein carrier protein
VVRSCHPCYNCRVNSRIAFRGVAALIFACSFGILQVCIAAQSETESSAKAIAGLLQEHYRRPRTLQAVFLERYSESQKQARIESGTVYFKRPGRMRWEYDSPEKKLFLADGKTVWFYVPYDHTVTKAPTKESSDWRTPLVLLTGRADLSRLCSRIDLIKQPGVPSEHAVLRCLPKGEEKNGASSDSSSEIPGAGSFTDVLLEVDTGSGELERIDIRQPGGIELEYRFGNWRTDIAISDDMFHFQVPAGVAVVDGAALSADPK